MFENIIGQDGVTSSLLGQISANEVPRSLIFYGEPYTGKLTMALELSRILVCEEESAAWNCTCPSCGQHRVLLHPGTIMMGPRYFIPDIGAAAQTLKTHGKPFARYLYIRALRKLTRRLDPLLWEGNEQKLKKIGDAVSTIEDNLESLHPAGELPVEKKLEKILKENFKCAEKICESGLLDSISIDHIRRVSYWAHTTSPGNNKIIIIENADKLLDGARNAFLKILEEPPAQVYFILLTTNRQAVIPTILSRVRPYRFLPRGDKETAAVIEKIFRDDAKPYDNLAGYFGAWESVDTEELTKLAASFILLLFDENDPLYAAGELETLIERIGQKNTAQKFLEIVGSLLGKNIGTDRRVSPALHSAMLTILGRSASRIGVFHQNASLALESMFLEMRRLV